MDITSSVSVNITG